MKIKAYPRHEIRFPLLKYLTYFSNLAGEQSFSESFKTRFLSLTDAKYAVLIPSCRSGVFHTLNFSRNRSEQYAISSTTFSAMKVCVDYFAPKNSKVSLIDNAEVIAGTDFNKTLLLTHLFQTEKFKISSPKESFIIEDCAHCFIPEFENKKFELSGDVAIFSFGIGKSLNTLGGGVLITNNYELYKAIQDEMSLLNSSKADTLIKALKTWIMTFATSGYGFTFITFPIIRMLSSSNPHWLDEKLNESVDPQHLLAQVQNSKKFNEFQAWLGLQQIKDFRALLKKRTYVKKMLLQKINEVYHPFLEKDFTYLMVPFKNRDEVRKRLLTYKVDTKLSDMDCFQDINHSDSIKNNSYLEIPFSENWNDNDIHYVSEVLNQMASDVITD